MSITTSRSCIEPAAGARESEPGAAALIRPEPETLNLGDGNVEIEVFSDARGAEKPWAELEEAAPASIYQSRRFLIPWMETVGAARSITPMIIVASHHTGLPLALIPLGVRKSGPVHIAEFLGGRDSNAGLALVRPGVIVTPSCLLSLTHQAARLARTQPDLAVLQNQPVEWHGQTNSLSLLPHTTSPSQLHACLLAATGEDYRKQQLSKDYRKKLRAKQRKLEALGPLNFVRAQTRAQGEEILQAFYRQKLQRFDDKNIQSDFDSADFQEFLARTCLSGMSGDDPAIQLHALQCGDTIIATFGGGIHQNRYHGMFNSFDAAPQFSKYSPGDILLSHLIDEKSQEGLGVFDLGIGESRYKQIWCNQSQLLCDTFLGLNVKGRAFARFLRARQDAKRVIKQSRWIWPMALKLRAKLRLT